MFQSQQMIVTIRNATPILYIDFLCVFFPQFSVCCFAKQTNTLNTRIYIEQLRNTVGFYDICMCVCMWKTVKRSIERGLCLNERSG